MRLINAAVFLLVLAPGAGAQEAWFSAALARSGHALFSSPVGVSAGGLVRLKGPFSFRATYDLLDDRSSRFAPACAGLLPPPPACPPEPIDESTSLRGVTLVLAADVMRRPKATLAVTPAVSFATIRSTGRGQQTGGTVSSFEPVVSFGAGAALTYRPVRVWPVSFHVGVQLSVLEAVNDAIVDGYSPFSESVHLTRMDLGVSVGRPKQR